MKSYKHIELLRVAAQFSLALLCAAILSVNAQAQPRTTSSSSATTIESTASDASVSSSATSVESEDDVENADDDTNHRHRWPHDHRHRNDRVSIGNDVQLRAGERADSLVTIMGSVNSEAEVTRDVVSVAGDARVTGPVGHDVVSVLGDLYINGSIGHDVVVTMGNVELGPQAVIAGKLVTVGSAVKRDPAAVVRGGVTTTSWGPRSGFAWLRPWIDNCLRYARPLALAPGLGWAWAFALLALVSYVLTALMAPRAVDRCVTTLETSPGYSMLAALLATLATPILFVLLAITVIGLVAIPFLVIAVLSVGFFGKLVMLTWTGRRVAHLFNSGAVLHAALATLIGSVIVTALYLVPVLGFVIYKLLGFVGFGVVVYTLILVFKEQHPAGHAAAVNLAASGNSSSSSHASFNSSADAAVNAAAADSTTASSTGSTDSIDIASLPRASLGTRMGALLLDLALVSFILNLVFHLNDILLLSVATYGALMWKLRGTTIGGILFNLRVVRLDGRELDWPTVIVRALSCFLSLIALGLGFIWIAFDPEQQAWHDKIAGTVVVRMPKGISLV
jgi:hypothetical protein